MTMGSVDDKAERSSDEHAASATTGDAAAEVEGSTGAPEIAADDVQKQAKPGDDSSSETLTSEDQAISGDELAKAGSETGDATTGETESGKTATGETTADTTGADLWPEAESLEQAGLDAPILVREDTKRSSEALWKQWPPWAVLLILVAIALVGVWSASSDDLATAKPSYHLTNWLYLGMAASFAALFLVIGWEFTGRWSGVLVDPVKNRMSLSQLQMFLWTVLFVSSWSTAVFINFSKDNANDNTAIDPLGVAVPGELLVLMGITATGLVGSRLVLNQKAAVHGIAVEGESRAPPLASAPADKVAAAAENRASPRAVLRAERPQWRDLFQGDTVQAAGQLDFGKVQLFYITIALLIGYGLVVADSFATIPVTGITTLPVFNEGFLVLLGISHAGYLTTKFAQ